jgi:Ferritin-like
MIAATIASVLERPPIPPISTREELIDLLGKAAEIEHAIMCQYLYAAFSIDRTSARLAPEDSETAREFVIELLKIARQEMEHLGIVTNLLIAVGAAPDFDRPNLPLQPGYYAIDLAFRLLPFGDEFLALAAQLEEPCTYDPHQPLPFYGSVAAIYERLRDGVQALDSPTLFLGANDPQVSNTDFGATPTQVWYDLELLPVTDLASALAAIDLIRVQGEGATATDPNSHYAIVCRMRETWNQLAPAARAAMRKPVPANPVTYARGDVDPDIECCVLRDDRAVALARLANRTYELLLLLLARLYGRNDATPADRDMYRKYAFFPLMTIVVRPVGEILTELPAGDGEHCAVCTFELDGPIRTYPDRASFHVQLGERLSHLATGYAAVAAMPGVPQRLGFVAKNVAYVRDRVLDYLATKAAP